MISVIIPAYNEAATIRKVIRRIRHSDLVMEIIVVDDNSGDNTGIAALKEGARVVTSSRRGKGISMHEGLLAASYDIIVYLDADILTYPKDIIALLTNDILNGEADFIKSCFDRQAGRVTQLVAKPLLSIFFPELERFSQPLSGMIAARKDFLLQVEFENDYGVDIGLLIDAYYKKQRIKEVNIGYIKNDMQSLESLGKMSRQVSATILRKAELLPSRNLETLSNIRAISDEMDIVISESIQKLKKIVIVDIGVVLKYDFYETAARYYQLERQLQKARSPGIDAATGIKQLAAMLKGKSLPDIQSLADEIPLAEHARDVIMRLKNNGYICALVSGGFDIVANHIKNKLGFDYAFANHLVIDRSIVTGDVEVPDYFRYDNTQTDNIGISYNKSGILEFLAEKMGISQKNVIYVSNAVEDIPMLQASGIGIATDSAPPSVKLWADSILPANSLKPLLTLKTGLERRFFEKRSTMLAAGIGIALTAAIAGYYYYSSARKLRRQYTS